MAALSERERSTGMGYRWTESETVRVTCPVLGTACADDLLQGFSVSGKQDEFGQEVAFAFHNVSPFCPSGKMPENNSLNEGRLILAHNFRGFSPGLVGSIAVGPK